MHVDVASDVSVRRGSIELPRVQQGAAKSPQGAAKSQQGAATVQRGAPSSYDCFEKEATVEQVDTFLHKFGLWEAPMS